MMDNAASRDMSIAPEETELASEEEVLPNRSRFKGIPILGGIWLLGAIADRIWFALDQSVPSWDEAEYLTGAMNYWRAFQQPQWFSGEWWTSLWQLSSKVPPLLYLSTAPFINFFGAGVDQSTLVNLLYSLVLLGSVYALSTRLFSVQVGLWAAGLCLLIPGLSMIRLTYLTDYPLVATVTLSFCWLTIWWSTDRKDLRAWGFAIAFGLTFGLALLVKQTALFFLVAPLLWMAVQSIRQRDWMRIPQLLLSCVVTFLVCLPWYRTNWLIVLTSGKRATVDSAIAEGDPSLLSLDAWTYYLKHLPLQASLPVFIVGIVGLVLYWKRAVVSYQWSIENGRILRSTDYGGMRKKGHRREIYAAWWQAMRWLLIFLGGGYLLCSLNINKDSRYITSLLPVLAIVLAQGLVLFPDRLRAFRWGAIGLTGLVAFLNFLPLNSTNALQHHIRRTGDWHQADVVNEVIQVEPYLKNTIGVLPSLANFNQHNLNYAGVLRNFQVYGRQVGTNVKQVDREQRSLSWFVIKDGEQGAIRQTEAQAKMSRAIAQSPDFQEQKAWALPDGSTLKLYQRMIPPVQVQAVNQPKSDRIKLDQLRVPNQAAAGKPMPITYRWSGDWQQLQSGLVILTWQKQGSRWFHDHAIGLGNLNLSSGDKGTQYQVVERLSALPPKDAQGTYTLKATYLNRETGASYEVPVPAVTLKIDPKAPAPAARELDFVTQLRSLSTTMPTGLKALDKIFAEVGQLNQLDPVQDYVTQTRQALEYRLKQDPKNLDFAYGVALSQVLKRKVDPAIAALETVTKLDSKNAIAYAYLAFVNLYDFRPRAAQKALDQALVLDPNLRELHSLNAVTGLMKGNFVQAWQEYRKSIK
jgi:4-amino-4-deoxy-L-arabinose transferase-like glycosyltransferase